MNPIDVMMLKAGDVIHYHGVPIYLTEDTRVMGRKENFLIGDYYIKGAAEEGSLDAASRPEEKP